MQYCSLDFTSITSHIHNWVLFLLWLCLFILSGVISPLISTSILGTYRPGEFIFQCPVCLLCHIVHGVLKARIPKWFALETNRDHLVIFEIASKYCILDSFVDYDGYSILLRDSYVVHWRREWQTSILALRTP